MTLAEVLAFSSGGEVVHLYRYHQSLAATSPPLWTVTSANVSETDHNELDKVFHHVVNLGHVHYFEMRACVLCHDGPLRKLHLFLATKLFAAFQEVPVELLECHVTCAQVANCRWVRGHVAPRCIVPADFWNQVCEYLAVYYLEPYQPDTSHHWLECALAEQPSLQSFVPVSTEGHSLLVLRNDCMLHRTPLLSNLIAGQMRRFFYIPFRALDSNYQPVQLVAPKNAAWQRYSHDTLSRTIERELQKHDIDMDLEEYVQGQQMQRNTSDQIKSETNNWLFEDPDDY